MTPKHGDEHRDTGARGKESNEMRPFIASDALPVHGARKISEEGPETRYLNMSELLRDNVKVERRRQASGEGSQGQRPSQQEIPDFTSWLHCLASTWRWSEISTLVSAGNRGHTWP